MNTAQRIIVENYLGAKYNIAVANDYFAYQATHAGEVAGIGRIDASNLHNDSQGSAIVRINNPSGLGNGEFLIWGHNEASMTNNNIVDVDGTIIQARLNRVWRADETGDVGTVDVAFDLSNFTAYSGGDLRLLIDRDGDGFFDNDVAPQSGALVGSIITFNSVDFQAGDYFTLGSINAAQTPLPVELLDFRALKNNEAVDLFWTSASELNSAYYKVMKSVDGVSWNEMVTVPAAGNSNQLNNYKVTDNHPVMGNNYYRLEQVDIDGKEYSHGKVTIYFQKSSGSEVSVFPNPSKGAFYLSAKSELSGSEISLYDVTGKRIPCDVLIADKEAEVRVLQAASGLYILTVVSERGVQNIRILLE